MRTMIRVVAVLLAIAIGVSGATLIDWRSLAAAKEPGEETSTSTEPAVTSVTEPVNSGDPEIIGEIVMDDPIADKPWLHFYNRDMIDCGDAFAIWNFGPNPMEDGRDHVVYVYEEFKKRMKEDPALAAAVFAWFDCNLGTRFMGKFYSECKEQWDAAINLAKEQFIEDQMLYYRTLDAFFEYTLYTKNITMRPIKGVTDQMYMNPFTIDGVPDVVVFESYDQTGEEIVFEFEIKGRKVEVALRVNCGFQPANVGEIMHITPQPNPVEKPKPKPVVTDPKPGTTTTKPKDPDPVVTTTKPDPGPVVTTKPTDPDPKPVVTTTKPSNPKDPDKAPESNMEPNDNPGPGPDTNNPKDPMHSTEDKPTNSTNFDSYDDYRDWIDHLNDLNDPDDGQLVGGDPNEPTTPPPSSDTNVDNNADEGTGNGGIDEPTPVQPPAHEEDGDPITTQPGEPWEGPPD